MDLIIDDKTKTAINQAFQGAAKIQAILAALDTACDALIDTFLALSRGEFDMPAIEKLTTAVDKLPEFNEAIGVAMLAACRVIEDCISQQYPEYGAE